MILELADIRIQPGRQQEFDAAIVRGVEQMISKAKGFRGYKINKGIESAERYVLTIFWETLETLPRIFAVRRLFRSGAPSSARTLRLLRLSSTLLFCRHRAKFLHA